MGTSSFLDLAHLPCRFKLRSGKEVFGVIWEVPAGAAKGLYFASVREFQRAQSDPGFRINGTPMQPGDIVYAEPMAH